MMGHVHCFSVAEMCFSLVLNTRQRFSNIRILVVLLIHWIKEENILRCGNQDQRMPRQLFITVITLTAWYYKDISCLTRRDEMDSKWNGLVEAICSSCLLATQLTNNGAHQKWPFLRQQSLLLMLIVNISDLYKPLTPTLQYVIHPTCLHSRRESFFKSCVLLSRYHYFYSLANDKMDNPRTQII